MVNSRGLRGPEIPLQAEPGVRRVLLLGDSTVFGVLVRDEQTFGRVAEAKLKEMDPGIEVLNGGAPGYSSWQALRAWQVRLSDYHPDLVVIATLWSDAQGARLPDSERFEAMAVPVLEHLFSFVVLREWVREWRWGHQTEEVRVNLEPPLRRPGQGPPVVRVPLPEYEANLRRISALVREHGGEVAFLVLPCIRDPLFGRVGDYRDEYRDTMRRVARELGAALADAPPAFLGGDPDALFRDDVHPTVLGHEKLGEVLASTLLDWARRQ